MNRLHHVGPGANRMADVDATPDPRIHAFHGLQHVQRRRPNLVFWSVIMDRNADVVVLDELLHPRQRRRCGISRHNHRNPGSLAVLKLTSNIRIFILREIDRSSCVEMDPRRSIVRQRSLLFLRIHREMIFHILRIQLAYVELLHEADQLCAREVPECVAGQSQSNRRDFIGRFRLLRQRENTGRRCQGGSGHHARANKIAARHIPLRHAAPIPARTRAPTSSWLPHRPESSRLSGQDEVPG